MDMNDLLKLAATAFTNSKMSGDTGSGLDLDSLVSGLSGLTGGNSANGGFDIGSILEKMQGGGMEELAQSWLGDGNNQAMEDSNVTDIFGSAAWSGPAIRPARSESSLLYLEPP